MSGRRTIQHIWDFGLRGKKPAGRWEGGALLALAQKPVARRWWRTPSLGRWEGGRGRTPLAQKPSGEEGAVARTREMREWNGGDCAVGKGRELAS